MKPKNKEETGGCQACAVMDKKISRRNVLVVILIVLIVAIIFTRPSPINMIDVLKEKEYRYCMEHYIWGGSIGKLCCTGEDLKGRQNDCAFYYNRVVDGEV